MQDTPSQTQQAAEAKSGVVALPLVARLLALGGAALFAVSAWLPWIILNAAQAVGPGQVSSSERVALTPEAVGVPPLNATLLGPLFVWSALTVLGIPLAALTWMRASRAISWLIVSGYGVWLLVTLIFSISSAQYLLQPTDHIYLYYQESGTAPALVLFENVSDRDPQIGLWISGVALLMCLAGLWMLISAAWRAAPSSDTQATSAAHAIPRPGAGTLTVGFVLWGIGFLWLAWASLGCPEFVLVSATCHGLSSDGAMTYAISRAASNTLGVDPRVGEYAISVMLTVGALLIGIGVWRRGVSGALCGWATAWLVAAAAFGALAWYGVNLVVNDPTITNASGSWRGDSGILFTAGALLICLVGVGLLWFALLFHRTQTSTS
jgi:hypothetical protein